MPATEPSRAVFLSYASQDAATAQKICEALRAAGIEVWFDQSELRGGDVWDQSIRRQIKNCALFIPVISRHTHERREGYFRLEWKLAVDRSNLISSTQAFLIPVVIDDTRVDDEEVPEKIRDVHWTRLFDGETSPAFVERIQGLLSSDRSATSRPAVKSAALPTMKRHPGAWRMNRALLLAIVVVIVAALAYLAIDKPWISKPVVVPLVTSPPSIAVLPLAHETGEASRAPSVHGSAVNALTPAAPLTSIAVMPFVNLTGDASKDYLGDGMAEEVINDLTKVPGIQVPARTSSFAYKGLNVDIRQIARDLNVGVVLEGSVRSAGKRVRITAQLINARTGLHMWSQTYDEVFTDLFRLQDDLASAIVRRLQVNLTGGPSSSVAQAPPTHDVQAYDLYLQGFSLMLRGSEQNLRLALNLFQQALQRDPTFTRALAAQSRARLTFLVRGYPLPNALDDADRDAKQALALDPTLGVAHQALANVAALRGDWLQADASYRTAIDTEGNNPDVHSGYAMVVLAASGHLQQAYEQGMKAYHLAPASPNHVGIVSQLSLYTHRDTDAVRFADLAVALGESPNARAQVYAFADLHRRLYTRAAERDIAALPPDVRGAGGAEMTRLVYFALADPAEKRAALQRLEGLITKLGGANHLESASRRDFIVDFAMLGALDPAYELATLYLDEFVRTGVGGGAGWGFLWMPEMRPFRLDTRFAGFVRRMNLTSYWQAYGAPDECQLRGEALTCR